MLMAIDKAGRYHPPGNRYHVGPGADVRFQVCITTMGNYPATADGQRVALRVTQYHTVMQNQVSLFRAHRPASYT
jgi:hypothetical protein